MPKIPIDYNNCCIYKIEHVEDDRLFYLGFSTNFNQRKYQHKYSCKNNNLCDKKYNVKLYQMMRDNGGWDMFRMIEIEKYPCKDKREAQRRETELIKELKPSMNARHSYDEIKEARKHKLKMKLYEDYTTRLILMKWFNDNKEEVERLKNLFDK